MASVLCLYGALHYLVILPASNPAVSIDSEHAHDFLAHARPRRTADPNWYHYNPDFQSYYRYYSSIGQTEGLYEIDKIRMLYQQMRHLELTYGPDASKYQNSLGLQLKSTPPPTTQPSPPTLPPVSKMDVMYLCNSKDPQCKPHIVYLPAGGVPVLCDPPYHPICKLSPVQKSLSPPVTASEPVTSASPPPPQKSTPPPPPPPMIIKGMEYDCDPYWDPDYGGPEGTKIRLITCCGKSLYYCQELLSLTRLTFLNLMNILGNKSRDKNFQFLMRYLKDTGLYNRI
uniref:Actinodin3 n=1 Tax=Sinocyclocheilus anshuiensis TaxID=1608454 RepID=A0A671QXA1_9TELE